MENPFEYHSLRSLRDLQQTSTVDLFHLHFDFLRLFTLQRFPWIWEGYFLSRFIYGLKYEIMIYVLQHNPCNLLDAYELALIQEYYLESEKTLRVTAGAKKTDHDAEIHNCAQTLPDIFGVAEDISVSSDTYVVSAADDIEIKGHSSAVVDASSADPISSNSSAPISDVATILAPTYLSLMTTVPVSVNYVGIAVPLEIMGAIYLKHRGCAFALTGCLLCFDPGILSFMLIVPLQGHISAGTERFSNWAFCKGIIVVERAKFGVTAIADCNSFYRNCGYFNTCWYRFVRGTNLTTLAHNFSSDLQLRFIDSASFSIFSLRIIHFAQDQFYESYRLRIVATIALGVSTLAIHKAMFVHNHYILEAADFIISTLSFDGRLLGALGWPPPSMGSILHKLFQFLELTTGFMLAVPLVLLNKPCPWPPPIVVPYSQFVVTCHCTRTIQVSLFLLVVTVSGQVVFLCLTILSRCECSSFAIMACTRCWDPGIHSFLFAMTLVGLLADITFCMSGVIVHIASMFHCAGLLSFWIQDGAALIFLLLGILYAFMAPHSISYATGTVRFWSLIQHDFIISVWQHNMFRSREACRRQACSSLWPCGFDTSGFIVPFSSYIKLSLSSEVEHDKGIPTAQHSAQVSELSSLHTILSLEFDKFISSIELVQGPCQVQSLILLGSQQVHYTCPKTLYFFNCVMILEAIRWIEAGDIVCHCKVLRIEDEAVTIKQQQTFSNFSCTKLQWTCFTWPYFTELSWLETIFYCWISYSVHGAVLSDKFHRDSLLCIIGGCGRSIVPCLAHHCLFSACDSPLHSVRGFWYFLLHVYVYGLHNCLPQDFKLIFQNVTYKGALQSLSPQRCWCIIYALLLLTNAQRRWLASSRWAAAVQFALGVSLTSHKYLQILEVPFLTEWKMLIPKDAVMTLQRVLEEKHDKDIEDTLRQHEFPKDRWGLAMHTMVEGLERMSRLGRSRCRPFPRSLIGWPPSVKISTGHFSFYGNIVVEMFLQFVGFAKAYMSVATVVFQNILHHKGTEIKRVLYVGHVLCLHKISVFSPSLSAGHLNMHHVYSARVQASSIRVQASSSYLMCYLESISCCISGTVYTLLQLQNHIGCGQIANVVDDNSFMYGSWDTSTRHTAIPSIPDVFLLYLLLYASTVDHTRDSITWEYDNLRPSRRFCVHISDWYCASVRLSTVAIILVLCITKLLAKLHTTLGFLCIHNLGFFSLASSLL